MADQVTVSLAAKMIDEGMTADSIKAALHDARNARSFKAHIKNAITNFRHATIVAGARVHPIGTGYAIGLMDPPTEGRIAAQDEDPYPKLSVDGLANFHLVNGLRIPDVMLADSIIYVWVSDFHLPAVTDLMREWDYRYRGSLVWIKPKRGLGEYVIGQHETVRVYVRGNFPAPVTDRRPTSLIVAETLPDRLFRAAPPRDNRHSAKPDRLYEMIESSYPQYFGPATFEKPMALELFARTYRRGWDGQGYEYPGRPLDELEAAE